MMFQEHHLLDNILDLDNYPTTGAFFMTLQRLELGEWIFINPLESSVTFV